MLNLNYFLYFIVVVPCGLRADGFDLNDIANNSTALKLLEKMITQGKLLNHLDGLERSVEELQSGSNIHNADIKDLSLFDIRVDDMPESCHQLAMPTNCAEATACTGRSGIYKIKVGQYSNESLLVECDIHTDGGPWIIIQRRQDGSVDFNRTWKDYQDGFGDIEGEFFIGLDKLHALTNDYGPQELMILMETVDERLVTSAYAKYDSFAIGSESDKYMLKRIGKYSGTAGDSLQPHISCKFSTKDQDNDNHSSHCAQTYGGAWWFNNCLSSDLNGVYGKRSSGGINWFALTHSSVSLTFTQMMIRRRTVNIRKF